jgi:hypothetical protein
MRFTHLIILSLLPCPLQAQSDLPPVVRQGLASLVSGNCEQAFDLWSSAWPEPQKNQLTDYCPTLISAGGTLNGFDLLKRVAISPHLERIYLLLLYDIQPIYMMLLAYKPSSEWLVNAVNWNTDPRKVVPTDIIPFDR